MMPYDRKIYGRPPQDDDIIYRRDFVVDGVPKSIVRNYRGEVWTEVNGERIAEAIEPEERTRVHLHERGEKKMDFPELEDLGAQGEAATDVIADTKPVADKICVIGAGQAGCKIAENFWSKGYRRVLLLNSTQQDMAGLTCPNQLIIGKTKTGAGKNPEVGAQAVRDSAEEILRAAYKAFGSDFDRIIIATSGGGGTGCGATAELVPLARRYMEEKGKAPKVGVIVCTPKKSEGEAVGRNSDGLIAKLRAFVEAGELSPLIMVSNERIGKLYPNAPITRFAEIANANIVGLYNVFNELAAQASPISTLDPSDYRSVLDSGVLVFGMTTITGDDPTAMAAAVEKNITGGMLSDAVKIQGATHAGAILVASKARLDTLPQSSLDMAFEALGRVLGGKLTLHSGVYPGPDQLDQRILFYTICNAKFV